MHIITTHKNTDFDALASVVAGTILYPEAVAVLPRSLNPNVKAFLSIHKDYFETSIAADIDLDTATKLTVVDTNSWSRLDGFEKLRNKDTLEIVIWDHHANKGDIEAALSHQKITGATATLMVDQIKKEHKILTPIQATVLLAGIYEDTGNLSFPSTTAEDAYAAGYLLERKADLDILNTFLRPTYGEKQKDALFSMLQNSKRTILGGHRISINKVEVEGHTGSLAIVIRMYMDIVNVDAAFGIFSEPSKGKCMVIGRSSVDAIDTGAIMRSMGGGGHPRAGSALLKSVNPDAVEEWIIELISGNQQASVRVSDLMSFPVQTVSPTTPMADVARILREKGFTGIPVELDNKIVGIISRRDFRKIKKESQLTAPVKAFMSPNAITIAPGMSPMKAAQLMMKHDIGRLPVVENGSVIGILTRSDTMLYFYDLLPD